MAKVKPQGKADPIPEPRFLSDDPTPVTLHLTNGETIEGIATEVQAQIFKRNFTDWILRGVNQFVTMGTADHYHVIPMQAIYYISIGATKSKQIGFHGGTILNASDEVDNE